MAPSRRWLKFVCSQTELRHRELFIIPFWLCSVRVDGIDSQMLQSLYGYTPPTQDSFLDLAPRHRGACSAGRENLAESWNQAAHFHRYIILALPFALRQHRPGTDYKHVAIARAIQGLGLPTVCAVSQLAYSFLPKNKNNKLQV